MKLGSGKANYNGSAGRILVLLPASKRASKDISGRSDIEIGKGLYDLDRKQAEESQKDLKEVIETIMCSETEEYLYEATSENLCDCGTPPTEADQLACMPKSRRA